jgi:transposase
MCLFVRDLSFAESAKLSRWLRNLRNGIQMRRAQIISFSGQGMRVQEIASHLGMNEEYLRELIRSFNEEGFDTLRQKPRSGRPSKLTEEEESLVAEMATAPPQAFGRPFNQWSLRKLRDFLVEKKLVKPVSHNVVRRVLKNRKITFQRTRTWKRSNDPAYDAKKNASSRSTRKPQKERP